MEAYTYLWRKEMKVTIGMENGRRERNNRKWHGPEQNEKVEVKTLLNPGNKMKKWDDKHYRRKGVKRQTNPKW